MTSILCVALTIGAATGSSARGQTVDLLDVPAPSAAVYLPGRYPVRVAHGLHVEHMDCADCHPGATTSISSAEDLLPSMAVCGECHEEARDTEDPAACAFCHPGYRPVWPDGRGLLAVRDPRFPRVAPEPVVRPAPNLVFSHALHAAEPCLGCHPARPDGRSAMPAMTTCTECHEARGASTACVACHPTGDDGRLVTEFPGNARRPTVRLTPADHDADWTAVHGLAVAADSTACFVCHAESDCLACHDGRLTVDSIHSAGYLNQHAYEARRDQTTCQSCHTASTFCVDCHADSGLLTDEAHRPPPGTRLHPQDWVAAGGGGHAVEAQRNLLECASCHAESDCAACHTSIDPHGPAFFDRCGALLDANPRVCLRCHASTTGLESRCR